MSFSATLAADLSVSAPDTYASLVLPNLTADQVEEIAAVVEERATAQVTASVSRSLVEGTSDEVATLLARDILALADDVASLVKVHEVTGNQTVRVVLADGSAVKIVRVPAKA